MRIIVKELSRRLEDDMLEEANVFHLLWPQPDWKWLEFANFLIQTFGRIPEIQTKSGEHLN